MIGIGILSAVVLFKYNKSTCSQYMSLLLTSGTENKWGGGAGYSSSV